VICCLHTHVSYAQEQIAVRLFAVSKALKLCVSDLFNAENRTVKFVSVL
jgi:hypothetical protein